MTGSGKRLRDVIYNGAGIAFLVLFIFVLRDDVGLMRGFEILFGGTLLIGIIATVVWVAWHLWQKPTTPTALEFSRRFEAVRLMDGGQFEVFVADLFRAMGHRAVVLGGAGDQGVDIVVNPGGERVAVQWKNYSKPVGNRPVQEVYAGARHHRCVDAWVVAPAGYTRGAIDLAKSTGVSLYDASTIYQWIRKVDRLGKERTSQTRPQATRPAPTNTPGGEALEMARKKAFWHPHPDDPPEPRGGSQKG
jgi:Restriction endonuclease